MKQSKIKLSFQLALVANFSGDDGNVLSRLNVPHATVTNPVKDNKA